MLHQYRKPQRAGTLVLACADLGLDPSEQFSLMLLILGKYGSFRFCVIAKPETPQAVLWRRVCEGIDPSDPTAYHRIRWQVTECLAEINNLYS